MTPDELRAHQTTPEFKAADAKAQEFLAHVMPLVVASTSPRYTDDERAEFATQASLHAFTLTPHEVYVALVTLMGDAAEMGTHLYVDHACPHG